MTRCSIRFQSLALSALLTIIVLGLGTLSVSGHAQATGNSRSFGSYGWVAPAVGSGHALGTITFVPAPGEPAETVLAPVISSGQGPLVAESAAWASTAAGLVLEVTVSVNGAVVHVSIAPALSKGHLQARITADKAGIALLDYGSWPSGLSVKTIPVPYYSSTVAYLGSLKMYANAWLDWHTTGASALNGSQAQYQPLTNGNLLPLDEQLNVAIDPGIGSVFPFPANPPSPNLAVMSGRMVVDVWGGSFETIAQQLGTMGSYGVSNCLVIIHNWQHFGYDNALPDHYPANPDLGGDTGLEAATEEARAIGCLVAVHENYVDYYPNYPEFNPASIALNSDGSRQDSWLNPSTLIQSFATKPNWLVRNATTQSPVIHQRYGTTASFLDVSSAVPPGFHVDFDAAQPGAGLVTTTNTTSANLWAYLRLTHQGPVVGEGVEHWYHSGLLDGVEAQTGAGAVPSNLGGQVPLFVNFDLQSIHPLQVNHGMGYANRWTTGYGPFLTTGERDAYRTQEIAFGHSPFLDDSDFGDASRALTESALVSPVASRYGQSNAATIQYADQGHWVSASQAALTGAFRQVHVLYKDGLSVYANSSTEPLAANGLTLPQFGWSASGDGVTAFTAWCGQTICDYAQTDSSLFANARNQSDIRIGASLSGPSVASFRQTGKDAFQIAYDWKIYAATSLNLVAFVHFVDPNQTTNEGIVFQGDYQPNPPTSNWKVGQTVRQGPFSVEVPKSLADGVYSVRVGLFDPVSGDRFPLAGQDDGSKRYIVGSITVSEGGAKLTFTPARPQPNDLRLNAGGAVVTFPAVQTDGMISITQQNGNWVLRPFPRFRNFTVRIKDSVIPMPAIVDTGAKGSVTPVRVGGYWQLPLIGADVYRWPVE